MSAQRTTKQEIVDRLNMLIDRYWDLAFAEGADRRDHDTVSGDANTTRREIGIVIQQLVDGTEKPS